MSTHSLSKKLVAHGMSHIVVSAEPRSTLSDVNQAMLEMAEALYKRENMTSAEELQKLKAVEWQKLLPIYITAVSGKLEKLGWETMKKTSIALLKRKLKAMTP